jgi:hypothetical protein
VAEHGHDVPHPKLIARFPRTRHAIREAAKLADATIFTNNSRNEKQAFTVCRVQLGERALFDVRTAGDTVSSVILEWLANVSPMDVALLGWLQSSVAEYRAVTWLEKGTTKSSWIECNVTGIRVLRPHARMLLLRWPAR